MGGENGAADLNYREWVRWGMGGGEVSEVLIGGVVGVNMIKKLGDRRPSSSYLVVVRGGVMSYLCVGVGVGMGMLERDEQRMLR